MERTIRGVLIDTIANDCRVEEISYDPKDENYLNAYYNVLKCDCFDIARRKIGEHYYDIYCDDEGLLNGSLKPSTLTFDGDRVVEVLMGNVFVCSHNEDGDTISLTFAEIIEVASYIQKVRLTHIEESRIVLLVHI